MEAQRRVYTDFEATGRLDALGLTAPLLTDAILWTFNRYVSEVTEDEPPMSPGMTMYLKLTGQLRRVLKVFGWTRDDSRNHSKTIHPLGIISIVVAGGDENTGKFERRTPDPCTVSQKGKATRDMLRMQRLFDLSDIPVTTTTDADGTYLYYLLVHVDKDRHEIRCELSQPLRVGPKGFVEEWSERIELPAIPFEDAEAVEVDLPPTPIIDVEVRRRSAEG